MIIGSRFRLANSSISLSKSYLSEPSSRVDSDFVSLGTDTEYVRERLAEYGNDLLSLGVDGMRLDAAKRE